MIYVFPAIFRKVNNSEYHITFPDLKGCITQGKDLADAIYMARDALSLWLMDLEDDKKVIPHPSDIKKISIDKDEIISMIDVDIEAYRRKISNRIVKKTLTIPSSLNERALNANINFSQTLQNALKEELEKRA